MGAGELGAGYGRVTLENQLEVCTRTQGTNSGTVTMAELVTDTVNQLTETLARKREALLIAAYELDAVAVDIAEEVHTTDCSNERVTFGWKFKVWFDDPPDGRVYHDTGLGPIIRYDLTDKPDDAIQRAIEESTVSDELIADMMDQILLQWGRITISYTPTVACSIMQ